MAIAHRRAVDAVRRNESQKRNDAHAAPAGVCYVEPAEQLLEEEERAAVRRGLGSLTELQLESVRLAFYHGYTYAEVATLLDKPVPTIKTRIRDGLIRLRRCLEEHQAGGETETRSTTTRGAPPHCARPAGADRPARSVGAASRTRRVST